MAIRSAALAALAAATFALESAHAASTTNFSDQWWIPSESGWGAAVLQQWDTLFVDLFVYGSDTKPTWFVAAAVAQPGAPVGHSVFTGDLYATTGPYFGGAFDPANVAGRKVGTLTFDADSSTTAALSYSVDATLVVKSVTRQTWRLENVAGVHYGGVVIDRTDCANPADIGHDEFPADIDITQSPDGQVTIAFGVGGAFCQISGTYSQLGHTGMIANAQDGCTATGVPVSVYEIERTLAGITGRWSAVDPQPPAGDGCRIAGRFGGVRR